MNKAVPNPIFLDVSSALKNGNAATKQKRYDEALAYYEKALIEQPEMAKIINYSIDFVRSKSAEKLSYPNPERTYLIVRDSEKADISSIHESLSYSLETKNKAFPPTQEQIFDQEWYLKTYKYNKDDRSNWLTYYNNSGWKRGEDPSPLFSTSTYLSSESGLMESFLETEQSPLSHYVSIGHTEKRDIFFNPLIPFHQRYTTSSPVVKFANNDDKRTRSKTAAFVHCYYIDIAERIIERCIELGIDVYAAFIEGTNFQYLEEKFGAHISYRIFQNRGRDIAPFVTGFLEDIKSYEYAVHLHTKRSLHYGEARTDWMDYCLESLLGNISKVEEIFIKHKNAAIVFPEPPDFLKEQMNWGHNFRRVSALLERLDYKLSIHDRLDFPAGSMFWFRTKDLMPVFELNISPYLFECESGQVDGTLAHAFERLFGAYTLKVNKKIVPIRKANSAIFKFDKNRSKIQPEPISEIPKSREQYNLSLKHFYPELTPFTFRKSTCQKPRLNLLVPTIDPAHIFGGIATAILFYEKLLAELGFEGRIISTDGPASSLFLSKFPKYSCYTLKYCTDSDPLQILSGVPRMDGDLMIRKKDVFIATSWWSANHLQKISSFQNEQFGCAQQHAYLVQDYEPHFYGWSSKSQLADETYKNQWLKIYNTQLLLDYFQARSKSEGPEYVLKPELNSNIAAALQGLNGVRKENIILLYGRPFAERNCNEILLEAISIWRANCPHSREWRVISLGQEYTHPLLGELGVEVLGKVSLEDYAGLLAKAKIGISLMVSPHPSYPPYEMLAAGLATYTNTYDNKVVISSSERLTMGTGSPTDIAAFLESTSSNVLERSVYDSSCLLAVDFGGGQLMAEVISAVANAIR